MSNEQEPAQADVPKEPEVKYVLSGQPTGWWAAAKDVREFDVEKVTSCKEDIDTLLVFAGLFSAVLSAFLVAVYPNLQQQPSDRIVYAIERVATQTAGYRVNLTDGTLIAANIPPPSPPFFQVSDEDIRVNVLWFASLIISLVTASFGMLVKQWLREFLASEDPSAPHRLRLRHFREPQMRKWMVYEIAGLLPILLHLSLGLFFVGLCYFTSAVHSSIGYTTVPLVVGWALCFFAATALPIFFPGCPYKVAFLKVLIVRLHRLVRRMAELCYPQTDKRDSEENASNNSEENANNEVRVTGRYDDEPRHGDDDEPRNGDDDEPRNGDDDEPRNGFEAAVGVRPATAPARANYMKNLFRKVATVVQKIPDEAILVESPEFDLKILLSVDAIQGNDEMLATVIPDALLYTLPYPADVVQLVMELLAHRVPTLDPSQRVVEYWPFKDIMAPLDRLRPQARDYILAILFGHIKDLDVHGICRSDCYRAASQSPGRLCRDRTAVFRALSLVASAPRESLLPSAVKFLERCFEVAYRRPGFWLSSWLCYDPATTDHNASQKLNQVLVVINLVNDLTNTGQIQLSLEHRVAFSTQILHPYFPDLVDEHIDFTAFPWDTWQLADSYGDAELKLSCMVFWLHAASEGLNSLHSRLSADPLPLVISILEFSLRLFNKWMTGPLLLKAQAVGIDCKPAYDSLRKMVHAIVKRESTALVFVNMLIDNIQAIPHVEGSPDLIDGWALGMVLRALAENNCDQLQQDPAVILGIFQHVTPNIAEYQKPEHGITSQLKLCQVLAFFFITICVPQDLRKECRKMFSSLATSLSVRYHPPSPDTLPMLARNCLKTMNYEDCVFGGKSGPPRSEEDSIFPDTLLDVLLKLSGELGQYPSPRTHIVMEPASTSNQEFDISNLVPSTAGGEPQPAYAMEDVEQTKAAHKEEENDTYGLSDATER